MRSIPAIRAKEWVTLPVGKLSNPSASGAQPMDHYYDALLVSIGHRRTKWGYQEGGPFYVEHSTLEHKGRPLFMPYHQWYVNDPGPVRAFGTSQLLGSRVPSFGNPSYSFGPSGYRQIDAQIDLRNLQYDFYTKGILRTRPGRPEADLGVFIGELRDFPKIVGYDLFKALKGVPLRKIVPTILAHMTRFLGASASEYLNWEFGWRPFVNDLRKFYKLTKAIDSRLAKLVAQNNKNIRRMTDFGTTLSTVDDPGNPSVSMNPVYGWGGYSAFWGCQGLTRSTATTSTKTHTWFEAGYRYSISDTTSWLWKGKAVAVLFGVLPSPDLVYSLTPWSWLLDWFTDLGDLVELFSPTAVEALVTRYAYTMRYKRTEYVTTSESTIYPSSLPNAVWPGGDGIIRSTLIREVKMRADGWAPFGSSIPAPALSARQLAILAALGITRATPS